MKAILAERIRTMGGWHWLGLFGLILSAWMVPVSDGSPGGSARCRADLWRRVLARPVHFDA